MYVLEVFWARNSKRMEIISIFSLRSTQHEWGKSQISLQMQVAKLRGKKVLFQLPKNSWKANRAGKTFSSLMKYKKKRGSLAGFLDDI